MFQLVAFKIYAIIKKVCFNLLSWTSTGGSRWEVFLETNLNQKTLDFICLEYIERASSAQLLKACCYGTSILVKNIFNPFCGTSFSLYYLKYLRKLKVSWCFQGHRKRPVSLNRLKVILSWLTYFVTYNWR